MGFWSKLAKGLAIGGAGLGTVLTAGAASPALAGALGIGAGTAAAGGAAATAGSSLLSKIGNAAKVAGPLASGIAAGQQKGREATNTAAENAANFKLKESGQNETGLENRADSELKQLQDKRTQQSDAYKKAMQSALAMNVQDAQISLPPGYSVSHITGGLRPSAFGAEGKLAASTLNKQAQTALMNGEDFAALPALERTQPAAYQQPGALENISGAIGMGANAINGAQASNDQQTFQQKILAAIDALSKKNQQPTAAVPPPNVTLGGVDDGTGDMSNRG